MVAPRRRWENWRNSKFARQPANWLACFPRFVVGQVAGRRQESQKRRRRRSEPDMNNVRTCAGRSREAQRKDYPSRNCRAACGARRAREAI